MRLQLLSLVALVRANDYEFPSTDNFIYAETFEQGFTWIQSSDPDYANQPLEVSVDKDLKGAAHAEDKTLILLEGAKKYGLVGALKEPLSYTEGKTIVLQYEVKFTEGLTCGGAYLKLLQSNVDLNNFNGQSPYTIMFGPDHCGGTNKVPSLNDSLYLILQTLERERERERCLREKEREKRDFEPAKIFQ
eukprot:CAMPEP_0114375200 /NCGR_PEP_ID=MMETSP0101-20121206/36128_1 /TAXON_ID=38822 ORGANISM="Pteridomonas danica, Strain PT" /NCGR_SAMPLE_ID=MMETSP0101 /ASSEMBLY_ACC=CAM_ASM_000211 /LENGTH=189 /DNA_ID=CAMNT_0001529203 /DNA_START=54 /DNA_END=623 /DNA_ORIENTATION=-